METDVISEARQRAQTALSRARLANDPEIKARWQQIADAWLAKLAHMGVVERPRPVSGRRALRGIAVNGGYRSAASGH
jgi:hypothetical protein